MGKGRPVDQLWTALDAHERPILSVFAPDSNEAWDKMEKALDGHADLQGQWKNGGYRLEAGAAKAMEADEEQKLFLVIIEWDGESPPGTWYNRMHALAGRVRGDKEQSPMERRDQGRGIIMQEGVILCPSRSLARTLAFLARDEFDARLVSLGEAQLKSAFSMSSADSAILNRIQSSLGKRGPKPEERPYVITCIEEMAVYPVKVSRPIQCPNPACASLRVHYREGFSSTYRDTGENIISLWLRTRFGQAHWEPATVSETDGTEPPGLDDILIGNLKENAFVQTTQASNILAALEKMPRLQALAVLDAIFVARVHYDGDERGEARMQAIVKYAQRGGDMTKISMAELPEPDLLDTALMLGPSHAVQLVERYV